MIQIATVAAPSIIVAAVFNLEDPAERFMIGVMQRVHDDKLYRAHALKRVEVASGRAVMEIASFNPPKRARSFMLIIWKIDEVAIQFKDCADMKAARAAFNAA